MVTSACIYSHVCDLIRNDMIIIIIITKRTIIIIIIIIKRSSRVPIYRTKVGAQGALQ